MALNEHWAGKVMQRTRRKHIFQSCTKDKISWWLAFEHDRWTLSCDRMSPNALFHSVANSSSSKIRCQTCMITSDWITSARKCGGYNYFHTHSIPFKNEYMWMDGWMDVNRVMWGGTVDVLHVWNVLSFQWIPHRQRIKMEFLQLFPEEQNHHRKNRSTRGAKICSKWFRVNSCVFL